MGDNYQKHIDRSDCVCMIWQDEMSCLVPGGGGGGGDFSVAAVIENPDTKWALSQYDLPQ